MVVAGVSAIVVGAVSAWSVRGRSSQVFGASVWRGPPDRKELALTFDDGPSPSTPQLLELLHRHGIRATFFVCGMHVRRLQGVAREQVAAGHELGNHTDTHAHLWLRSPEFIYSQLARAQESIETATGTLPSLLRVPYGVRWFGLDQAQSRLGLTGVMWSTIARDWSLQSPAVAERLRRGARNGALYCLHDGRETQLQPDITNTIEALRRSIPELLDLGYKFRTAGELTGLVAVK
jgi:peptidoglycan/xylan/chitin deacetylase (PgdA/CDA1 family)